jgi:hypothetical protein
MKNMNRTKFWSYTNPFRYIIEIPLVIGIFFGCATYNGIKDTRKVIREFND